MTYLPSRSNFSARWRLVAASLLTVDIDVESSTPVSATMVKALLNNVLDHLAENLKLCAEQLAAN